MEMFRNPEDVQSHRGLPPGAVLYVENRKEPPGGRIEFDHEKYDDCGFCVAACRGAAIGIH